MQSYFFYVVDVTGERRYFAEDKIKEANAFAKQIANATGKTAIRYDINGGQSWFSWDGFAKAHNHGKR